MDITALSQEIFTKIKNACHVGIVGHKDPDGDALGSILALSHYCDRIEVAHIPFCADGDVSKWYFLPGSFRLRFDSNYWRAHAYDVLVFLDTPDVRYAGLNEWLDDFGKNKPFIINIDHHHDNERFGDINVVIDDSPAAAQILYELFVANGVTVDRRMATCLLCGLLIDTSHFSNAATNDRALEIGADLVRRGANIRKLVRNLWQQEHISSFTVWGRMLSRLQHNEFWDIVSTVIPYEEFLNAEGTGEGMSNFLNYISEGKCALIIKEIEQGVLKGSFRTTRNDVDVSRLARMFGGGGHKRAAGFVLNGRLEQIGDGWKVV